MRFHSWMVVFALLAGLCCRVSAGADDAKKLQGTWEVTDLIAYGKKVEFKTIQGTKFVFAGDKLTIVPPNDKVSEFQKRTFTVKVGSTKKPAEIDLTALDGEHKGVVSPGIYSLEGDTLRWCQPDGPKSGRPQSFASPEKTDIYLFTLKRSK